MPLGPDPAHAGSPCAWLKSMARDVIEGTTWQVREIDGTPTTGRIPELTFGDDGRLSGSTGVNRLMGQYELGEGVIRFGNAGSTRVAGPTEAMEQESRLLAVITGEVRYVLMGDRLVLGPAPGGAVPAAVLMQEEEEPVTEPAEVAEPVAEAPGSGATVGVTIEAGADLGTGEVPPRSQPSGA